jgi:hypothetical protein
VALVRTSGGRLTCPKNCDGGVGGCVVAGFATAKGWLRGVHVSEVGSMSLETKSEGRDRIGLIMGNLEGR